ncbi:transient-receptor-potential-like protein [Actinia tenebrosa]|uniref:Transient-receptor-potential-like protein n=1 Tax=Actinia tenebrosa TaxID=6105 RepID=A0A6P8I0U8_ACTTE|nr:transient-receptor-potential-like protein [Actinia tenebrosa]
MKVVNRGLKQQQATSAFVCPISVLTSLYSLEENENHFIESAKKGELEKVGSFLDRQKHDVKVNKMLFKKADGGEWRLYFLAEAALVLAVHENNREVVQLILSKGFLIREPHSRSCQCKDCSSLGVLLKSLSRLNTYSALSSPLYLSYCYLYAVPLFYETPEVRQKPTEDDIDSLYAKAGVELPDIDVFRAKLDPIYRAFELNGKLEIFAATEYEFMKEYRQLSNQCEEYASDLLNLCRNMHEIGCVMSMTSLQSDRPLRSDVDTDVADLSVLNFAIKNKNERFVAHPYSQLMLNSVLYKGLYSWQYRSFITKYLFLSLFFLFFPVWSLFYLMTPHNSLSSMLATPLAKFCANMISFMWFLGLLTYSSMEDKFGGNTMEISLTNVFVTLWVIGLILEEIKELYRQGRQRYFSQWWNIVTIVMLVMFILAGLLWMIGYSAITEKDALSKPHLQAIFGRVSHKAAFQVLLLSSSFYAMAFLLSFLHISNALQVNSTIGPLHLSLVQMCRDLSKFLLLFCVMYFAFALAVRKVYSQYVLMTEIYLPNSTSRAEHKFSRVAYKCVHTVIGVKYDCRFFISVIQDDADIQWKFSRTRMWMQYVDRGSVVPPPFNLIPSCKSIISGLAWLKRKVLGKRSKYEEIRLDEKEMEKKEENQRRKVIENLIERYFARRKEFEDTTARHLNIDHT